MGGWNGRVGPRGAALALLSLARAGPLLPPPPAPLLKKTRAHPPALPSLAQVIGVGGGGSNAVNRMMRADMKGIDLYVINTDSQVK